MRDDSVQEWLTYAKNDLETAQFLLDNKKHPGHTLFHCHESIEKYLKAIILKRNKEIPYVHQLYSLLKEAEISERDTMKVLNASIVLDELYRAARYPSGDKEVSRSEAQEAIRRSREIETILLTYLDS
ncbi:MAG: HEPN domain-containing protein [bacterium]|nr:HEPN domain-containing protein [bacterium]